MENNKKGERQIRKERSFTHVSETKREGGGGAMSEGTNIKKERSFLKHHHHHHHHHNQQQQQQQQQQANNNNNNNKNHGREQQQLRRRSAMPASNRSKPAMELYRPPTLRGPGGIFDTGEVVYNGKHTHNGPSFDTRSSLNVNAKEFVSVGGGGGGGGGNNNNNNNNNNSNNSNSNNSNSNNNNRSTVTLQYSKSSSNVPYQGRQGGGGGLQHSKSGSNIRQTPFNPPSHYDGGTPAPPPASVSPPRVHFCDDKENEPDMKQSGPASRPPSLSLGPFTQLGIKRSKSLGSADMRASHFLESCTPMPDLGPFSPDVMASITRAMNDPNSVSARQLMEVVRHLFTRVVEASRHAEPTARLCISIIQKEKNETFLETLLNTCQEYFQERDRLLRNNPPAPYPGFVPAHPRWIAYMTFLNEMYTQLKRRHVQLMTKRMRNSETPPGLLLLTLLAQCCQVCLKENAVNSLAETECLFFVLTGVGKDIEVELPSQMARVMTFARDAFLTTVRVPAVRKTLLQLIEMHAARWQLPAPAVMYYYPGSGSK